MTNTQAPVSATTSPASTSSLNLAINPAPAGLPDSPVTTSPASATRIARPARTSWGRVTLFRTVLTGERLTGRRFRLRSGRFDQDLHDSPAVHVADSQAPVVVIDNVPPLGNAPEPVHEESGDRLVVTLRQVDSEPGRGVLYPETSGDEPTALPKDLDTHLFDVVLVSDLSDQLFEHVLECDNSGGSPVFVDNECEMATLAAHVDQQRTEFAGFRNDEHLPDEVARKRLAALRVGNLQEILHVEEADDLVEAGAVNGKARVARLVDQLLDLCRSSRQRHSL